MKTSGYNLLDIELKTNKKDIKNDGILNKRKSKKKTKYNFDFLFPSPENNENMGLDNIFNEDPFKGVI